MAERDGAAVDVDLVLVDAEHPDRVQRHGCERLVDLPQVDLVRGQPGLLECLLRGVRGRAREVGEVLGRRGLRDDLGEHLLAVGLGPLRRRDDDRAAAVVDARRVAGRVRAVPGGQPLELGERLERAAAARRLVDLDDRVALATLDGHRDDLLGQPAGVRRLDRELVRAQRPAVQIGPRELELVADLGRLVVHLAPAEGVGEPVVDHRIQRLGVAHAKAEARARQQVRGAGHRLHAAADADVEVPRADLRVEDPDRAHARGADLVDRLRADLLRDARLDLRLARGNLALPGLQHLTHDHVLDVFGGDVGALQGGLDGDTAELGRVKRCQTAAHLPDRGACGAEDHGRGHVSNVSTGRGRAGRGSVLPIDSEERGYRLDHRAARGHRRRHRRPRDPRRRGCRARCRRRVAGSRRQRRGEGQAPPSRGRARGRQALGARRPRQARRARRREGAGRGGVRARPRAGDRRAQAVLGGAAQGRPADRRGDRRGHAAVRLPLRPLQGRAEG